MGLAATSPASGGGGASAWTTTTVAALIAAVLAVAGVSLPGSPPDGPWCVTGVVGQASRISPSGGHPVWEGESLSAHTLSTVAPAEFVSTHPAYSKLWGEIGSDGAVWLIALSGAITAPDTVPYSDGDWDPPGCLFLIPDTGSSAATAVEAVWDGFQFGFASP